MHPRCIICWKWNTTNSALYQKGTASLPRSVIPEDVESPCIKSANSLGAIRDSILWSYNPASDWRKKRKWTSSLERTFLAQSLGSLKGERRQSGYFRKGHHVCKSRCWTKQQALGRAGVSILSLSSECPQSCQLQCTSISSPAEKTQCRKEMVP